MTGPADMLDLFKCYTCLEKVRERERERSYWLLVVKKVNSPDLAPFYVQLFGLSKKLQEQEALIGTFTRTGDA